MSFRLNFDLSLSFPSPPPRSDDDMHNQPSPTSTTPVQGQDDDGRRRPQGWWRTARQHPHFVLRVIYLVTTLMGLILDTVLLSNIGYYYYAVVSLHQTALVPVSPSLLPLWIPLRRLLVAVAAGAAPLAIGQIQNPPKRIMRKTCTLTKRINNSSPSVSSGKPSSYSTRVSSPVVARTASRTGSSHSWKRSDT